MMVLALAGTVLLANPPARGAERPDVRFERWEVPQGSKPFVPHDPAVGADGSGWYTAFGANTLGRIDSTTGQIKEFGLPTPDSGPHGIIADRDGRIWYTGNRAGLIGRLDPATGAVSEYRMPDPAARDPHTLVFDSRGELWFTVQNGNYVGRLDPSTGAITLKPVATSKAMPHGIVISPSGSPYFAMAGANKIGRIDPRTLEITEYTLPDGARPRRLAAVSEDAIWYGDSARGFLSRLDPRTGQVKEFASPGGARSAPYSIASTSGAILVHGIRSPAERAGPLRSQSRGDADVAGAVARKCGPPHGGHGGLDVVARLQRDWRRREGSGDVNEPRPVSGDRCVTGA